MSTLTKVVLGVLCIGPIALWIVSILLSPIIQAEVPSGRLFEPMDLYPGPMGKLALAGIVIGVIASIVFAVRTFRDKGIPKEERIRWSILLLLGNLVALPIYWFIYVWRNNGKSQNG
ncbi:MAG: hypothetical protein L0Y80_07730 [Ignavibacteriae bacterium]|nr:hypothetical protein [Ignavibacteriota bacterium]